MLKSSFIQNMLAKTNTLTKYFVVLKQRVIYVIMSPWTLMSTVYYVLIRHPVTWMFCQSPTFSPLYHFRSLTSTCLTHFHIHFLSSSLLFLSSLSLCQFVLSALPLHHHVTMDCSDNHLLFSAVKSCYYVDFAHSVLFHRSTVQWLLCAVQ